MATVKESIKMRPKIDKAKAIAAVGLLGGLILLIYGLSATRFIYEIDESLVFRYIHGIISIVWASLALFSSVILLKGNEMGYKILLIAAIGGIVGSFIPIFSYDPYGYGYIQVIYLNGTAAYFDLVIMLIGAILGIALTEKKERQE